MVDSPELLTFPTDYPIKVLVRASDNLRLHVDAIMARHAHDIDLDAATERLSANENFLAISYKLRATSREQIVGLVTELTSTPGVIMVI